MGGENKAFGIRYGGRTSLNMHLIISVDFLPLSPQRTRWFVTICHNYYTDTKGKIIMNMLARKILLDDFNQMRNQSPESELKRKLMFRHRYPDETTLVTLKDKYNREYIFPTLDYVYEQIN